MNVYNPAYWIRPNNIKLVSTGEQKHPQPNESFDQLYDDLLYDYEESFCTYDNVRILATTFNVNGKPPPEVLYEWLSFDTAALPDLIVVGLQEIDINLGTYFVDNTARQDEWLFALRKNLPNIYVQIDHVRLTGIFLVAYIKKGSKIDVSNVFVGSIPTGFLGQFGNKGGVGISLRLNDSTICFINSHFAHGNNELLRRNQDFRLISQMKFSNGLGIYDHDAVIWIGDLNYRLDVNYSFEEVVYKIEICNNHRELFQYDQLREQQRLKAAFNGFQETIPDFKPTYKFDAGTQRWDTSEKRRIPAWCDRVLFWVRDKKVKLEQNCYECANRVVFSDHKPVLASFNFRAKTINLDKKQETYEKMLKESDKKINDLLPQISLSQMEFKFKDVFLRQPYVSVLEIKNTGVTYTHFTIKSERKTELLDDWITITPRSSSLDVGSTIEITIQVEVNDESLIDGAELQSILVIHLDGGRDYFIVILATIRKNNVPVAQLISFDE